jgi:hypothetical protein
MQHTCAQATDHLGFPPLHHISNKTNTNSMASVRELTIPTEQPPLVGEVSSNFCGWMSRSQRGGSPTAVISDF